MISKNGSLTVSAGSMGLHMQDPLMDELLQDYAKIRHVYAAGIREITSRLEVLESEFQYSGTHNPIHHIESRVKTLASIVKKLETMHVPLSISNAKKNLHDIAGVRVICCYFDDIFRIANALLSQDDVSLVEKKDYIESPKENGYRSLHIVVDLPVYLSQGKVFVPVEVQIRTVAMDFWASLEHSLRYKASGHIPDEISQELMQTASDIAHLDQRMQTIHDKVEALENNQ